MTSIIFNGLELNDGVNYWVEDIQHEVPAKPEVNIQKIARTNRSVILRKGYGVRIIKAAVIIQDSSIALLEARIDEFKASIESIGKNLDIEYAGSTRRYVAAGYIESEDFPRKPRWARFTIRFECYQAFGEDTAATTESFAGKTTNPYTDDIEIEGTAPAVPDITITINSLTATGDKFIQIKNLETGDYVKITLDTWAADDIVQIYTGESTVLVNGVIMPYLGIMPVWNPGDNDWEYSDDFTARNVDIDFSYKKRWL